MRALTSQLKALATAGLLVTLGAGAAHAQRAASPLRFGVLGGASAPTGDLADGANVGIHLGGMLLVQEPTWPVALRADLQWHRFGAKDATLDFGGGDVVDVSGSAQIVPIVAAVQYTFPSTSASKFYVLGGGGAYYSRAKVEVKGGGDNFAATASDTKFGINLGAGFNFNMGGRIGVLEARLHRVSAEEDPETGEGGSAIFVPISFGIRF